ncbi:multi-sensor signal transduction histidine kinase [Methylobacterium sp. 4-46]|uniref:histidine kinase dimerization/phosphoacceptor domain -containing protein n=1 Tax=unclassified Methylobacterium TaxID=2615210 RepID=UPI000165C9DA|nr:MULTISPECIES: histidine kinase dimerization/phosphoacceptor domain -containing protein [Methylobacterium]ACA17598.1 multi-sensor signal transduction histidine kinase [Methylobacterium sp. 4-46]WFT83274.1 histidine kinase dimerization/phosphoacceptor domain -containing protein [Methylobacterium nodulans]
MNTMSDRALAAEAARLDALSTGEIDALDLGVVQVDSDGTILLYNRAESVFSGRSAERVVGRNFFRDVAPCTRLPAFYGRFREGVRRGVLDEVFSFAYGFDPQPLRVRVALRGSATPGRYWIVTRPVGQVTVSEAREAVRVAVDQRVRAEPIDPDLCAREPIHVPGAIQPHAVLLACDAATLTVAACSANAAETLGAAPLGRPLAGLLPDPLVAAIRAAAASAWEAGRILRWRTALAPGGAPHEVLAHRSGARVIVELERVPADPADFAAASLAEVEEAIGHLRAAETLAEAARVAAREARRLTGFDCILIYRFDADWNGEAIAEARDPAWDRSLLGLHFPASDIPAQARALYARAKSRFVIDRDYVPVPLLAGPDAPGPIDLTFAQSRSLSPIHLEYQRNLGVNGSMSVSILLEGRLWGLMIGHHRKPHYVAPETRAAAGLLTDALALRLHELESRRLRREQQAHLAAESRLVRALARSDDVLTALTSGETTLLDLFGATGAAIVAQGAVRRLGAAPPDAAILAIAAHLRARLPAERSSYAATEFAAEHPPTRPYAEIASGLLAAFVDPARDHLLLWFRPEVSSTVTWGGDPRKPVLAAAGTATMLPRRSFERWVEERRGAAEPFAEWQVGMAEALAQAVEGVVLRQRRKIAELTGLLAEKEALLAEKDLLAKEIDHRVKNSLQIVSAFLHMQRRQVKDPAAQQAFSETMGRVMSVARVHDSLYQTESVDEVDLGQTIENLCADLSAMAGDRHTLELDAEQGLMVPYRKAVALSLIATELVTNAFKYAYDGAEGGRVSVSVASQAEGRVRLSVRDEGRGLPTGWAEAPARGTGLGMKLVRAMLEQINARIEVEPCLGTCFTVTA